MTNRDEATGQFAANEPVFGREAELVEAGYSLPPKKPDEGELTVEEAAEAVAEPEIETKTIEYADGKGEALPLYDEEGIPVEGREAISLDRAFELLTEYHKASSVDAVEASDKEFAEGVDKVRAERNGQNQTNQAPAPPPDISQMDDTQLEKTLESHPAIKQRIEAKTQEAAAAIAQHQTGISETTGLMLAMFAEQLPELAAVPQDQWQPILAEWHRTNDPRLQKAIALDQKAGRLIGQVKQEVQRAHSQAKQTFDQFAKAEDSRFEEAIKGDTRETQDKVQRHLIKTFRDYGIEPNVFLDTYQSQPFMRSAAAQRFLYDATKAMMELAALRSAPPKVVPKDLPQVQRPGAARSMRGSSSESMHSLNNRLNSSGSIEDGLALLQARRSNGG